MKQPSATKEHSTASKPAKQVQIVSRNVKSNGYVYYVVKSSNGKDEYATTLRNGKATACTCPSRKPCYHMLQLQKAEKKLAKESHLVIIYAAKFEGKTVDVIDGRLQVVPQTDSNMTPDCPQNDLDELNTEEEELFQQIDNDEIVLADEIKVEEEWKEPVKAGTQTVDYSQRGNLNGNRAFSLTR